MKHLLTALLVSIVSMTFAQSNAKLHTYLTTESMGVYPKSEGLLNIQLVQNLKGIAVMEDKKTSLDLKVTYFVIKYTYKGKMPIEFPVEGSEFPSGLKNKFFANAKSGDKITIEQIRVSNSNSYNGPGTGITVMEYTVK